MLKQIQEINQKRNTVLAPVSCPSMPKLQKIFGGWISVPQPDSIDPSDWYYNDPTDHWLEKLKKRTPESIRKELGLNV